MDTAQVFQKVALNEGVLTSVAVLGLLGASFIDDKTNRATLLIGSGLLAVFVGYNIMRKA